MEVDYRTIHNEKVNFSELLNKQIDRIGTSSLIPERIHEESGVIIKPPVDEAIRGLLYLLYSYISDKDEIKNVEWENPSIEYWSKIMIVMMDWMKKKGMLMSKIKSEDYSRKK